MISVIVPVRNTRAFAANCLSSLLNTFAALGTGVAVEFILMDDDSDPIQKIPELFAEFRSHASQTTLLRFKQRQHYTRACALGFSIARGNLLLLVSHDMMITAEYVKGLIDVAHLDESFGIVRGTSQYVDCFPQHTITPPLPLRNYDDVVSFSSYIARYYALARVEDHLLTGDSVLIKRSVLEKIGVMDGRYFGYFGDIDLGLRAQRAGFKLICAKGAWLHHEGAGHYRDQSVTSGTEMAEVNAKRMQVVNAAYLEFRAKWDPTMPGEYPGTDMIDFEALRRAPSPGGGEFQAPIAIDPAVVDVL